MFLPFDIITSLLGIYPKKIVLKERNDDVIETVFAISFYN